MNAKANTPQLKITPMSSLRYRPVEWLWQGRIPLGAITLIAGPEDNGKTFLWTDLVSRVTRGTSWPDGSVTPRGDAFVMIGEDSAESTIYPRLQVHNADLAKVHMLGSADDAVPLTLQDCDAIEDAIASKPSTKLLVVDPLGSFVCGGVDTNRENVVRGLLAPLRTIAERRGIAVVLICHYRKTQGSQTGAANDRVMGSRAFNALARATWHLLPCPDKGRQRKLLVRGKCNLSKLKTGLAFGIQADERLGGEVGQVCWEAGHIDMGADDVLARLQQPTRKPRADHAKELLRDFLSERRTRQELESFKQEHQIGRRRWDSAKHELDVQCSPAGFGGAWTYSLPEATREVATR